MEAKDGSFGFDFGGVYDDIIEDNYIEYTIGDGRKVKINFSAEGEKTKVVENFEAESTNPLEMQKVGWQTILDNFKKYTESNKSILILRKCSFRNNETALFVSSIIFV